MFAKLTSFGLLGIDGCAVTVEADTSGGLPAFDIVGLPDAAITESRERVRLAVKNSGYKFPVSRITVNLAPADMKKTGTVYDVPIMLSLLIASSQLRADTSGRAFVGELSLDGSLRPVGGALPMAFAAAACGIREFFVPAENAREAAIVEGLTVYGIHNFGELARHLEGKELLAAATAPAFCSQTAYELDFSDVKGQPAARRAMEIAAAGMHNILLIGPAGTGKSMLAKRLPSILPPLTREECLEVTKIYSVSGRLDESEPYVKTRPFRAPHHTVSAVALTGGGSIPRPGEISKAHRGVLFLDELTEFPRSTLEVLRAPLEDGAVTISRSAAALTYPCRFLLAAAMNPCPCGNFGNPKKVCTCTPFAISRYLSRISGPLLDRIDLHVEVAAVDYESMASQAPSESSADIRARVIAAREIQTARYKNTRVSSNAELLPSMMAGVCRMTDDASRLLARAFESLGLSARAYDKVLKVARTIADLDESELIEKPHIAEAVSYRTLDKKYWNA